MTDTLMVALAPLLFLSVLLMMEIGHRYRLASHMPNDSESNGGVGPAIGTVLALMGLVLAFRSRAPRAGSTPAGRPFSTRPMRSKRRGYASMSPIKRPSRP